jgi:hypothetical protein
MKAASVMAAFQLLRLSGLVEATVCAAYSPAKTLGPERS